MFANLWYDMPEIFRSTEGQRDAETFHVGFSQTISRLCSWEEEFTERSTLEKEIGLKTLQFEIFNAPEIGFSDYPESEKVLFSRLLDLFALKNGIGPANEILRKELRERNEGKFISFVGPLGVGKSTISKVLIDDLRAGFVIREPYTENPFWGQSQTDGSYMFQIGRASCRGRV